MYDELFSIFDRSRRNRADAFLAGQPLESILSDAEVREAVATARAIDNRDGLNFEASHPGFGSDDLIAFQAFVSDYLIYYCCATVVFYNNPGLTKELHNSYVKTRDLGATEQCAMNSLSRAEIAWVWGLHPETSISESLHSVDDFSHMIVAQALASMVQQDSGIVPRERGLASASTDVKTTTFTPVVLPSQSNDKLISLIERQNALLAAQLKKPNSAQSVGRALSNLFIFLGVLLVVVFFMLN